MTYNASGQIKLTIVNGTSLTGFYAADGSWNAVFTTENTTLKGFYHPCGAMWANLVGTPPATFYAIDGSVNVMSDGGGGYVVAFPNTGSGTAPTTGPYYVYLFF